MELLLLLLLSLLLLLLSLLLLLWLGLDDRPLLLFSLDGSWLSLAGPLSLSGDAAQLLLQGLGLCIQLSPSLSDLP